MKEIRKEELYYIVPGGVNVGHHKDFPRDLGRKRMNKWEICLFSF